MALSKDEQYRLLETYNYYELQQKFGWNKLDDIFDITEGEYVAWEVNQPLNSGVRTAKNTYDGFYFIESEEGWEVYWQERGGVRYIDKFQSYEEARLFFAHATKPSFIKPNVLSPNKSFNRTIKSWLLLLRRLF